MPNKYTSNFSVSRHSAVSNSRGGLDNSTVEMYQSFMTGYVRRINEATFKVAIGGVRIGSAKYSRLAQINLKSRIITFSRYAIENVPERGRRYLVIHELAHVIEAGHNKRFWELVERYEPQYKAISRQLELAFTRNVREEQLNRSPIQVPNPVTGRLERPKLLLANPAMNLGFSEESDSDELEDAAASDNVLIVENNCSCLEVDFEDDSQFGIVSGGSLVAEGVVTAS